MLLETCEKKDEKAMKVQLGLCLLKGKKELKRGDKKERKDSSINLLQQTNMLLKKKKREIVLVLAWRSR